MIFFLSSNKPPPTKNTQRTLPTVVACGIVVRLLRFLVLRGRDELSKYMYVLCMYVWTYAEILAQFLYFKDRTDYINSKDITEWSHLYISLILYIKIFSINKERKILLNTVEDRDNWHKNYLYFYLPFFEGVWYLLLDYEKSTSVCFHITEL